MGKFHVCLKCKEEYKEPQIPDVVRTLLSRIVSEHGHLLYPRVDPHQNNEDEEFDLDIDSIFKIMFPSSVNLEAKNYQIGISSHMISVLINKYGVPKKSDLAILYVHQHNKYRNVAIKAKRFTGNISIGNQQRIITNIKPIADDSQIKGSDNWMKNQDSNVENRLLCLGQTAIKFEIKVPFQNEEVQANSFLLDNVSVTISFEGDELLEQERKFYVHLNHQAHELCTDNCEKIEMNEYIQTRNLQLDSKKLITTYLHSFYQVTFICRKYCQMSDQRLVL